MIYKIVTERIVENRIIRNVHNQEFTDYQKAQKKAEELRNLSKLFFPEQGRFFRADVVNSNFTLNAKGNK